MMKTILAAAASVFATSAFAADLTPIPFKAPVSTPVVYTGTGFYAGAFVGGNIGAQHFDFTGLPGTGNLHPIALEAGAKIGYATWLSSGFMLGLEADAAYSFNGRQDNPCALILNCTSKQSWLLTQRGLIGVSTAVTGNVIPYLTGGVAERLITAKITGSDDAREWLVGWTAGAGVRVPMANRLALDISYLYVNYNKHFTPSGGVFATTFNASSEHVARAAVVFGF